jgi:hypothetical protein
MVEMLCDNETHAIRLDSIASAKLILNDALLKAHKQGRFVNQKEAAPQ